GSAFKVGFAIGPMAKWRARPRERPRRSTRSSPGVARDRPVLAWIYSTRPTRNTWASSSGSRFVTSFEGFQAPGKRLGKRDRLASGLVDRYLGRLGVAHQHAVATDDLVFEAVAAASDA